MDNNLNREGWVCPKCGRVYSPDTPMCWYCSGTDKITCGSSTGDFDAANFVRLSSESDSLESIEHPCIRCTSLNSDCLSSGCDTYLKYSQQVKSTEETIND